MVKKYFFMFIGFLMAVLMAGCEKNIFNKNQEIVTNFESEVKISLDGQDDYIGTLVHTPEGITTLTFNSPESLKGLSYSVTGGKYELSKNSLVAEYNMMPFQKNSYIFYLLSFLDYVSNEENQSKITKNKEGFGMVCENEKFDFTLDGNGRIKNICMPSKNLNVEFTEYKC